MRAITLVIVCCLALAGRASAESRTRVAVLEVHADEASVELARTLSDLVAYDLEESGRFEVITRADITTALQLKGIQQHLGCETVSCQAELGKAASVTAFVTGTLGRVGSRYVLLVKLVDVSSLRIVRQARQIVDANEDALLTAVSIASAAIAGKIAESPAVSDVLRSSDTSGDVAFGGLGLSGSGVGGGGMGSGPGLGSIGTIGHGSGAGMGGVMRGQHTRPPATGPALTTAEEDRLALKLRARMATLREKHPRK